MIVIHLSTPFVGPAIWKVTGSGNRVCVFVVLIKLTKYKVWEKIKISAGLVVTNITHPQVRTVKMPRIEKNKL